MSKQTSLTVFGLLAALAVLTGAVLFSKSFVKHEEQKAAQGAVDQAARQASTQVAQQGTKDEAKRISDTLLAGMEKKSKTPAPTVEVSPSAEPVKVEREAFTISLPSGCKVRPADPDVGSERMVTADLTGNGSIIILVADKKEDSGASFDRMLDSFRQKLDKPEEEKPDAFGNMRLARATGVMGTVNGIEFVYQIGQYEGWNKQCLLVLEYPQEDKSKTLPTIRRALDTFRMKQ